MSVKEDIEGKMGGSRRRIWVGKVCVFVGDDNVGSVFRVDREG